MAKKIGLIFLVLLLLLILAGIVGVRYFNNLWFADRPNYLSSTYEPKPMQFQWTEFELDGQVESHTAMIIPVKIHGLAHKFYLQFDTGAPSTLIYGKSIPSLKALGLDIQKVLEEEDSFIEHLEMDLGGSKVKMGRIEVLENYGNIFGRGDTLKRIKLGTLGADFLDKRVTLIDFNSGNIRLYEERPSWMSSLQFKAFDFSGRRFMLPAKIQGKDLELFYDSGSSAFGLITSKNRYDDYTDPNQKEIQYVGNRFGESLEIFHKPSQASIEIGNATLPLRRISYVGDYANFQRFMTPFTRIGGWLGNKPLLDNALILDTKKEEFIVIESLPSGENLWP